MADKAQPLPVCLSVTQARSYITASLVRMKEEIHRDVGVRDYSALFPPYSVRTLFFSGLPLNLLRRNPSPYRPHDKLGPAKKTLRTERDGMKEALENRNKLSHSSSVFLSNARMSIVRGHINPVCSA